jgi:3'(2'), 5'-bisphosphate nucleotidase
MAREARRIAREAGNAVLRFYGNRFDISLKADQSPLTEADQASHDLLVARLSHLTPDVPVVSEEDPAGAGGRPVSLRHWLIDPLDGTKEFIKGTDEFTVNIALINDSGPALGVVLAPALGLMYHAIAGTGAWRQLGDSPIEAIHTRPADTARLAIVASKDHAGPQVSALLNRFPAATLKNMGSSLKFCLVAEGSADIYLRDVPTMEWDTAAAQCVVESAGGAVLTMDGERLSYGKPGLKNPSLIAVGDRSLPMRDILP